MEAIDTKRWEAAFEKYPILRGIGLLVGFSLFGLGMVGFMSVPFGPGTPAPLLSASGVVALDDGHVVVVIEEPPRLQIYNQTGAFVDSKRLVPDGMRRIRRRSSNSVEVGSIRGDDITGYSGDGQLLDKRHATYKDVLEFPDRRAVSTDGTGRQVRLNWSCLQTRNDDGPWLALACDSTFQILMWGGIVFAVVGVALNLLCAGSLMRPRRR